MIIEYSFDEDFKKLFKKLDRQDKAYYLRELDGIGEQLDLNNFSRQFFSTKITADISVDSNANVDNVTVVHYNNEIAKSIQRLNSYYLLWKYGRRLFNDDFSQEAITKQFNKEIYINDFHGFNGLPYCYNFSCMDIICNGIQFSGSIKTTTAKHISSFMGHVIAFLTYACNQILGACGLADLLICCAWYTEKLFEENKSIPKAYLEKQIKQELQAFIYQANQPFRSSLQSPFSNISIFDDVFLTKLCDEYIFPDGRKVKKETVKYLQNIFLDLMNETLEKTAITFPIITACFATDENNDIQDKYFLDFIVEKNMKFGIINIYAGKSSTLSSCCRLRSETDKTYFNQFGAGGTKIGSLGVVTLNLPRLAYESKNESTFFNRLKENAILASRINHVKRFILKKRIEQNQSPLYSLGFINLKTQYSTCGVVGINECLEILGYNILEQDGQEFVLKILNTINEANDHQEKKYDVPHNMEQVPAESSGCKLADADKLLKYNKNYPFYSNQFIPLTTDADILDRIKLQGQFDKHMTGGAICHLNIADKIEDSNFMKKLITHTIKSGVIYHAINYNLQKCENDHINVGKNKKCIECGKNIIENFTRIVGFLTNVNNWGKTRREIDYPNRKFYDKDSQNTISSI